MGTPQFPDLGKHCSLHHCRQLDFLPFTCDRCHLVFCLEHRSYIEHKCPKSDNQGVTVTICPLCAKGVRLDPNQHPNITWDSHLNTECDPSNFHRVTQKKRCPVPRCRETLTFSNTINCKDCAQDHCLKHRFGLDHNCPGPKKQDTGFSFSSRWSASLLNAASTVRGRAEEGMAMLMQQNSNGGSGSQECPRCRGKFASVASLIEHEKKIHRVGVRKLAVDVCPMCSRGFGDAVALVEHVERDHRGVSKV